MGNYSLDVLAAVNTIHVIATKRSTITSTQSFIAAADVYLLVLSTLGEDDNVKKYATIFIKKAKGLKEQLKNGIHMNNVGWMTDKNHDHSIMNNNREDPDYVTLAKNKVVELSGVDEAIETWQKAEN